jgi:antitoxin ParD1/3/4
MSALTVSLSDDARAFVETQAAAGGFESPDSYVQGLIRAEQKRKAREQLDTMLLEALQEPATEMTKADWADLRRELEERISQEAKNEPHRPARRRPSRAGGKR